MQRILEHATGAGTVVAQSASSDEAVAAVQNYMANAAFVEIQMPVSDGLAIIAALRTAYPQLLIAVCTFEAGNATRRRAYEAGCDAYLVKPVSARELRAALNKLQPAPSQV